MLVWMGPEFAMNASVLLAIHSVTFCLLAVRVVSWQVADGLGRPDLNFWTQAPATGVYFVCAALISTRFGSEGIASARLVAFSAIVAGLFLIEKKCLGKVLTRFWGGIGLRVGGAVLLTVLLSSYLLEIVPRSLPGLILSFSAGALAYLLLVAVSRLFSSEERRELAALFTAFRSGS